MDGISNGLQYAPQTDGSSVKSYDSLYQRHFEYESSGEELLVGAQRIIVVTVFKEKITQGDTDPLANSLFGTISLAPALNADIVASKKGASFLSSGTSKINVNNQPYIQGTPADDVFFTKIEPSTGFMIEQKKNLTVFF